MIVNIVDNRKNKYKWLHITAIVEPTWHDNVIKNGDWTQQNDLWFGYDELEECSISDAIEWASKKPGDNTLFIYDLGDGIRIIENVKSTPKSKG